MSSKKNKKPTRPVANLLTAPGDTSVVKSTPVASSNDQPNNGLQQLKEETLRWIFSIACSLAVYIFAAIIIQKNYAPDINSLTYIANKLLVQPGSSRPEPMEAMLFRVGVITCLCLLPCFYMLFSKKRLLKGLVKKSPFLFLSILCIAFIAALIYFDFAAINPFNPITGEQAQNSRDLVGTTNFDFYFNSLFLGNNFLIYLFFCVPLCAYLFFLGIKKYNWENNKLFRLSTGIIGYTISGGIVLAIVLMHTFQFPYTAENKYDFNAVYYSMTQVYAGLPMLTNGFTNTYGLYPQLLNPIFQVIGLSIFNFSMVMSVLLGLAFVFNFYSLQKFTRNKIILFLGFLTIIFFPFLDFKILTPFDCIFSQFPIRYIIPSTLVFLTTLYLTKRSKAVYWVTFIVSGFFILWNPEIGSVCYLSWIIVNSYNDFYAQDGSIAVKKILFHWLAGISILLGVFYTYKILIYFIYGAIPDMSLLFNTILVFGKIGFNLLPMALVHPWNIMTLALMLGFAYAVSKWYKKDITQKASIVLLTSLIGLGYFFYFQGRSHNWSFSGSSGFCLLMLTILGDELWHTIRTKNIFFLNALFVIFLFIVSFSFFEIIFNINKINELVYQDDYKENQIKEEEQINSNTRFILNHSKKNEKIFVLTAMQYQGLYFNGSKRVSAFEPGMEDMFLKADLVRMGNVIRDSSFNIFIEPALCGYSFLIRPLAAAAATYELKDATSTMSLLQKRKTMIPAQSFLGLSGFAVLHKKYTDDTSGLKSRINDALGLAPVALGAEFSVEVLFNSKKQIYPYATLAGNMNDSSGFIIANVLNSPNYFFGINGKGVAFPFPENEWVYCVMNVFPDHLEVYSDGNLVGTLPLPQPMRKSPEQLYIGNLGYLRYYVGAIAEVAINNKALDKNQMQVTWEKIKESVK